MGSPKLLFLPPDTAQTGRIFTAAVHAALAGLAQVVRNPFDRQLTEAELIARVGPADFCVTGSQSPRLTEAVVAAAPRLRLVLHSVATVKPYVSAAVYDRGILVSSGSHAIARVTAEASLAMMMIGNWEAKKWTALMEKGGWRKGDDVVPGVRGRVIGIVGFGAITQALLAMLRPLAPARVLVCSAHLSPAEAAEWGVETRGLMNAGTLRLIRDSALLINMGRGELIDEPALVAELASGRIRAVLDVYAREPLDAASPLRRLPNVTCFPHVGGATDGSREALGWDVVENLREHLRGEPPHGLVSRERALAQSEY